MKTVLTAREREVAALVAEGMTNREIAERLVISERTAEYHVEQIRNKLGLRSRAQVAAWIGARAAEPSNATSLRRVTREPPADLVGRADAYAALVDALNAAIAGEGHTALVLGEPGAGKTRLLAEIARAADAGGMHVVRGAAGPAEVAVALQPWMEALSGLTADAMELGAPWSGILAAVIPAVPVEGSADEVAPELRRARLFEAVARLLARSARTRPVAVLLDDLHYADADSMALLHYVVRTSRGAPLALVVTARPSAIETNAPFATVYRALVGQAMAAEVALEPLSVDAVAALLRREPVDDATARDLAPAVHRWSGGNPFFSLEAIRTLRESGSLRGGVDAAALAGVASTLSDRVRRMVLARLDAIPAETQRALEVLAVLARPTRVAEIASLRGRDEIELAQDLGASIRTGIAREIDVAGAPGVVFAHELIREAMYQQLPAMTRAALHARVARALVGAPPSILAHHLARAGSAAAAADAWIRAGDESSRRFAYDAALESYRAALGLLPETSELRAALHERVAEAELARGAAQAAIDSYAAALERNTDPNARTRLATALAAVVGRYEGEFPSALDLAADAVASLERRGDPAALGDALVALAWMQYRNGDSRGAEQTARRVLALGRALELPRVEAAALEIVTRARWLRGDALMAPDEADVEDLIARLGDHGDVPHLRWMQAMAMLRRAEPENALRFAEDGVAVARRVGSIVGEIESAEALMWALVWLGRYREGVDVGDAILPLSERIGLPRWPRATADFLHALVLAGERERVVKLAREILDDTASYAPSPHVRAALFAISALVAVGACDRLTRDRVEAERPTCETCRVSWLQIAGRCEAVCGDTQAALAIASELEQRVVATHLRQYEAGPAHIAAVAHARSGQRADADRARGDAIAGYEATRNIGMRDLLLSELAAVRGA